MKAEVGKRYAQLLKGKVHWIFTSETLPEWQDSAFEVVDITDQPEIVAGYRHLGGPAFAPPLQKLPDPIEETQKLQRAAVLVACVAVEQDATVSDTVKNLAQALRQSVV